MRKNYWVIAAVVALASCGGGGSGDRQGFELVPVGDAAVGNYASVTALSADGSVAAGDWIVAGSPTQAFRWTQAGGMMLLGNLPGGTKSFAGGISSDGSVVAGTGDGGGGGGTVSTAYRWAAGSGMQALPPVEDNGNCSASDVSGDGTVVVGVCYGTGPNVGFRWTAANGTFGLGRFGTGTSGQSLATAVSRDGATIVGSGLPSVNGAMMWTPSGTVSILGRLALEDSGAYATAVSRDGLVVAGNSISAAGVSRMFRWTEAGGMQPLGPVATSAPGHRLEAMSGDGHLIAGWLASADGESDVALVWTAAGGVRTVIDFLWQDYGIALPSGWYLMRTQAVSDDGRTIGGVGRNPSGQMQGWLLRLPG